jgi:hypothetical protein
MFTRVYIEEWYGAFKSIGFVLFLTVFIFMFLRAILLPKKEVNHDAALPFDNEKPRNPNARPD